MYNESSMPSKLKMREARPSNKYKNINNQRAIQKKGKPKE